MTTTTTSWAEIASVHADQHIRVRLRDVNAELDRIALKSDRKRRFLMFSDLGRSASKAWLVKDFLGQGEASTFYGTPGCGKSVLIEDMSLHIAESRDWFGRKVKQGAVLYVALERRKLVERRAIAFRVKYGIDDLPFALVGGVHDFRAPRTADHMVELCAEVESLTGDKVVLIVIDTLSRALCGGDENSPKDMGALVTATSTLQERTGAHVLWVHHTPHDGERPRGHGALLGGIDATVFVRKSGGQRTATVIKANDGEDDQTVSFSLEGVTIGEDGTSAPVVVAQARPATAHDDTPALSRNQKTMFGILHDAGAAGLTTEEWNARARAAEIGSRRKADLYDIRTALKAKGLVRQFGDRWTVNHA